MAGRYAEAHKNPSGPTDARPTGLKIVEDEGLVGKLTDKVALVTGTTSGIGIDTVDALAYAGMTVFCTARDLKKADGALAPLIEKYGASKIQIVEMDNGSLESVRRGAQDFLSRAPSLGEGEGGPAAKKKKKKLNLLVANAGIMRIPEVQLTPEGHELQFGTNHVAHFLLFQLLRESLLASATPEWPSRVVMVSSSGHRGGPPNFGDYTFSKGGYDPGRGYAQSKCANVYMANQIERLYASKNLHATSLMPGGIWTGLQKHVDEDTMKKWRSFPGIEKFMKSTAQGAATTVWAALGEDWKHAGGKYLEDCAVAVKDADPTHLTGYMPHAYDEEGEKRLWSDSLQMVGIKE